MVGRVTDPVCRMEIRPEEAIAIAISEGRRVYFCSESCYEAFLDVPHRYLGWEDRHDRRGWQLRRLGGGDVRASRQRGV